VTHVPITISASKAAPYQNRNRTLSQNVMLACDFDLNFVYVSTSWEGSASDTGVLRSTIRSGLSHRTTSTYGDPQDRHGKV